MLLPTSLKNWPEVGIHNRKSKKVTAQEKSKIQEEKEIKKTRFRPRKK